VTSHPTRRTVLTRLGLAGAATGLSVAVGEEIVRMVVPKRVPLRFDEFALENTGTGGAVNPMDFVDADPELFWRFRKSVRLSRDGHGFFGLISNGQGLRMDHEVEVPRPASLLRILFLGDSCTFGYLLRYDQTTAWQLEALLRLRFPDRLIECANAGVVGWTLFQGWRFLETEGAAYAPQLVVVNFGWNEGVDWHGRSDAAYWQASRAVTPPAALRWSRICQLAWRTAAGKAGQLPEPVAGRLRVTPDEFIDLLGRVERWTQLNGAELLLLVGGARLNLVEPGSAFRTLYQEAQYAFGRKRTFGPDGGPAFVDGAAIEEDMWKSGTAAREIFLDGVHPSAASHVALAMALDARIGPWIASHPLGERPRHRD
jgi:lysophospholipase L1-like esterase